LRFHTGNDPGYSFVQDRKAASESGIREIAIAGGVSANSGLRSKLNALKHEKKWNVYIPPLAFTTDNAAMIAIAGVF